MLYESVCAKCHKVHLYRAKIAEREQRAPQCCGLQTIRKILTPPMGRVIGPAAG